MKILLKIKYDGRRFHGYQAQPERRTVQGELNSATEQLFGCKCNVTGCSRTDSGVHALSFYATVEPSCGQMNRIPTDKIPIAINNILPEDISVVDAYDVFDTFHPRYDVVSKEYTYYMLNESAMDPFLSGRALHLKRKLDSHSLDRINAACTYLIGKHDFASFMAEGSQIVDTTRTIFSSGAEFCYDMNGNELVAFKICGNGFLYNMVRIIVGTMLDVAYDKLEPHDIEKIIEKKSRSAASNTSPACGLYLTKVEYPDKNIK